MTNRYILSIDPGVSTGVSLVELPEDGPPRLVEGWQFGGGVSGLISWTEGCHNLHDDRAVEYDAIICEKFRPINHDNYALTTKSVEPLRCEGALIALGWMSDGDGPEWRLPRDQYLFDGGKLADKKKRLRAFLKNTGLYRLPKELDAPDNNDFVSATGHALAYAMKVLNHRPTFDLVREYVVRLDDKENK